MLKFFATCPLGLESLLLNELKALNVQNAKETVAGVYFEGQLEDGMRACLWSHYASRILLTLSTFYCDTDTDLYMGANGIAWEEYFTCNETIAVEFSGTNDNLRNTQYSALKVKDAICDRLQKVLGSRPSVDKHNSDVRIFAHLQKNSDATIGLDLSGTALHQREIHRGTGVAPLKENLAAAMVARTGYDGLNFLDPMCGSGTLLLEAAMFATDTAPGLHRKSFGFLKLKSFDNEIWQGMLAEAKVCANRGLKACVDKGVQIIGFDADPRMVEIASTNAKKAGFESIVKTLHCPVSSMYNPFANDLHVSIVTNPPYGQRMGNFNELIALYGDLGLKIKENFNGARVGVISTSKELLSCLRLSSDKSYKLYNGSLECQLRVFDIVSDKQVHTDKATGSTEFAEAFANRLTKNIKFLQKWAATEKTNAYRVYDADLPDYQAAIDKYANYYVIQEYQAPSSVNAQLARRRVLDMISATIRVTGSAGSNVILKSRERQKGLSQYEKAETATNNFFSVYEKDMFFKVNLEDYLDTGLFLDARPIRAKIRAMAKDKDFLNLFAYTGSASVAAALGGAKSTVSVDMSKTYLDWAIENFELNSIELKNHDFIQADCLSYLSNTEDKKFDLIYIDPPTFSNSKRMEKTFEVQRDHVQMLANLTRLLKNGGSVIFCTNRRGFKIEKEALAEYGFEVIDITDSTIPRDFMRRKSIHTCFILNYDEKKCIREVERMVSKKATPKWSGSLKKESSYTYKGEQAFRREKAQELEDSEHKFIFGKVGQNQSSYTQKSYGNKSYGSSDDRGGKGKGCDRGFNAKKMSFNKDGSVKSFDRSTETSRGVNKAKLSRVWGPNGVKDL